MIINLFTIHQKRDKPMRAFLHYDYDRKTRYKISPFIRPKLHMTKNMVLFFPDFVKETLQTLNFSFGNGILLPKIVLTYCDNKLF